MRILELRIRLQEGSQSTNAVTAGNEINPNAPVVNPQKLLPLFDERRDDLHAYLQRFERVATGQGWPQEKWAVGLSMCLSGEALTVIGRMTADESLEYSKVKKALLQRFRFTATGYQEKFRKARAEDGETGRQFAARLSSYFDHWVEMANISRTYEGLRDLVISEQFYGCCHPKLVVFLKERECATLDALADTTDCFLEAQNLANIGKAPTDMQKDVKGTTDTQKSGSGSKDDMAACALNALPRRTPVVNTQNPQPSDATGHDCEDTEENSPFLVKGMPVVLGRVLGKVARVLRDTGSNTAIVRRDLVDGDCFTGKTGRVVLLDGSIKELPEARIQVHTPYLVGEISAACMACPLYDLVLGNIPGVREPHQPDLDWEYAVAGDRQTPSSSLSRDLPSDPSSLVSAVASTQESRTSPLKVAAIPHVDVNRGKLAQEQNNDPTLTPCYRKIGKEFRSGKGNYYTFLETLPAMDAVHVSEALVEIFSRVGIPQEMITDQGANFTSELMKEVGRLLSVKLLHTSPYHAMANGLVEKFNGTLKSMIKKMCQEKPRTWDRYLAPLLFAYREVPQASLGFSPFDLIYGRHVRGPLTVLKEIWTNENIDREVRTTYSYLVDLRDRLEQTCRLAHEELQKAHIKQKKYYDRKCRRRKLHPGEKVLILLPTALNKLLMQWKGPFKVLEAKNDVDYLIDLGGKSKVFHVNMLKRYEDRKPSPSVQASVAITTNDVCSGPDGTEGCGTEDCPLSVPTRRTQTATDVKLAAALDDTQLTEARSLLQQYETIFSDLPGKTNLVTCALSLTSEKPVHIPQFPVPLALLEAIESEVQEMLRMGIIEKSQSPYHAPIVVVRKPDGTIRLCIDFRELNKILLPDSEPIPRIDVVLARVGSKKFFSKFDLTKGYWQVPMDRDSREKTAFSCTSGLYHFRYMPFGIKTAPAVFARLMRVVLGDLPNVYHYFDGVVIATDTWAEHLDALGQVFERIREANLTIKPSKCEIGEHSITFLGHRIGGFQVKPMLQTLEKILGSKRPETKRALQSFLGLANYYRKFIPNYAAISKPLTDLTKKGQRNRIAWGTAQEDAFNALKSCLASAPILRAPDLTKPFVLRTDASNTSLGAVLLQSVGDVLHPVAYASRNLLPRETRYSTIERECLALYWAVQKFHIYLYGKPFIIESDHQPLQYLQTAKHVNNRVLRWSLALQEYSFTVHYIKGADNVGADYMSRI
ncbi:uncharacterized protein LOC144164889 [Haemaphysalis longicornis]